MTGISLAAEGDTAVLRLHNEAKLNALTMGILLELEEALDRIEGDDSTRCLIVTGEGSRAFCAGADINEWSKYGPAQFASDWIRKGHRTFDCLARMAKPTIAAINGHALGGGLELAAACDVRVMAPKATLALPEASVGVVPGWSGTQRLARLLPESVIKEMALFGRRLSAERAFGLGFVAEVSSKPLDAARKIAVEMASLSPRAVETCKRMYHAGANEDRAAMIDALASAAVAASEDKMEGVAAFRDKRAPQFTGA